MHKDVIVILILNTLGTRPLDLQNMQNSLQSEDARPLDHGGQQNPKNIE
jgi:hypothetical protein